MNARERTILRIALSYMISNLDDVCECFRPEDDGVAPTRIDYNGELVPRPTDAEICQLLDTLQG